MSGGSSVYSPLPQSNSDSEYSEEELHSSNESRGVINHISKLKNQSKPEVILNGKKPRVTNYKQLDNDRDIGITLNGFQLANDDITILKPNNKIEKFSTSRKICFSFSIFLCVFITVFFLWILPCEIGSCPPAVVESWRKFDLFDLELHGPISVVPNPRYKSHNLVFLYRKSFSGDNKGEKSSPEGGGVISLLGAKSEVSWHVVLKREPKDIDCNIIDVDQDGLNDCLVVESNNLLKAIQSLTGNELWDADVSFERESELCDLSFPVTLPDVTADYVSDLLTVCSVGGGGKGKSISHPRNYFALISGRTGTVIGKLAEISHCSSIRNFILEKESVISYTCVDSENKESVNSVPLRDILLEADPSILNKADLSILKKVRLNRTESDRPQHKIPTEGDIFHVQGRRLSLENRGRCPGSCSMIVEMKEDKGEKSNQTLMAIKSSYGMIPVVMKFGKLTGFVIKYWQWLPDRESGKDLTTGNKSKNDPLKQSSTGRQRIRRLNNPPLLENDLFRGSLSELLRFKRTVPKKLQSESNIPQGSVFKGENYTFHRIAERVVLIIFNETDTNLVNASQTEITQICKSSVNCQPDVVFQKQSLLITDVDHDSYHELISYSSSFVNRSEHDSQPKDVRWQLQSVVQVIRLEAELPKLYDNKNH